MNFAFTDDQLAFGRLVRDLLTAEAGARGRAAWGRLAAAGFFGLLVPERYGGLGLRLADALPALEETGRACLDGPVVDTAIVAPRLLEGADLERLAAGGLRVAVRPPGQTYLADADLAELVVAWPHAVHAEAARLTPRPSPDPARPLFAVTHTDTRRTYGSAAPEIWRAATVATAAQLIGLAGHLLDTSVQYARARVQFGRPIGSFQAVQHRLADVAIAVEFAAPLVWRAALSLGERDVSAAKAAANEAADLAARGASQVHGAIGYTSELPLRRWLARVWSLTAAYGGATEHRATIRAALPGTRWP